MPRLTVMPDQDGLPKRDLVADTPASRLRASCGGAEPLRPAAHPVDPPGTLLRVVRRPPGRARGARDVSDGLARLVNACLAGRLDELEHVLRMPLRVKEKRLGARLRRVAADLALHAIEERNQLRRNEPTYGVVALLALRAPMDRRLFAKPPRRGDVGRHALASGGDVDARAVDRARRLRHRLGATTSPLLPGGGVLRLCPRA